jgi:phosphatidylglycerophosphatase A
VISEKHEVKNSIQKILVLLSTGFGLGLSRFAPGTVGSIPGMLIAFAINANLPQPWLQAAIAAVLAVVCIPICDAGEKHFGTKDPHPVVADEYLTFPLCVIGLPPVPWIFAVAFVTNRIMDILKPFPARQLQRLPGGLGITIDDVFSSLYSLAANWAIYWAVMKYM